MTIEQSLVIIKPDGIVKSLTGNIISVLSETKLRIVGAKIVKVPRELAERHYEEHRTKPFYEDMIDFIMGLKHKNEEVEENRGRVFAMVYHGKEAIQKIRTICGATNPEKALPTSIRGKYGRINSETGIYENVIHASDSLKSAEREIKIWFQPHELAEIIFPTQKIKKEIEHITWL